MALGRAGAQRVVILPARAQLDVYVYLAFQYISIIS